MKAMNIWQFWLCVCVECNGWWSREELSYWLGCPVTRQNSQEVQILIGWAPRNRGLSLVGFRGMSNGWWLRSCSAASPTSRDHTVMMHTVSLVGTALQYYSNSKCRCWYGYLPWLLYLFFFGKKMLLPSLKFLVFIFVGQTKWQRSRDILKGSELVWSCQLHIWNLPSLGLLPTYENLLSGQIYLLEELRKQYLVFRIPS